MRGASGLLLCCCSSFVFADEKLGALDLAQLDREIRLSPLLVASQSYVELNLEKNDIRSVGRQRVHMTDWQTTQEILEQLMDKDARQLHRKYTFQYLVGSGRILHAFRYANVSIDADTDVVAIKQRLGELREQFIEAHLRDTISVCTEALRPVIEAEELREAIGQPFRFRAAHLKKPPQTEPFEFDRTPLDLLRSNHVRLELKLDAKQLTDLQEVSKRWQSEVIPNVDGEEDNVLREKEALLLAELGKTIQDQQFSRLRQLMLQRVLSWYQLRTAIRLLGLNPSKAQRRELLQNEIGLQREVTAAKHFRGILLFAPLVKAHMKRSHYDEMSYPVWIPGSDGKKPSMTAAVFAQLGTRETKPTNPRRER